MIARIWHGKTDLSHYEDYSEFLKSVAVPDYLKTPGCGGLQFLRRKSGGEAHFVLVSFWQHMDAIRAFAGDDIEKAKYYPQDQSFLLEFEEKVQHYEVFASQTNP